MEQRTRKAKMQRVKGWLVAGGCSASQPLKQLPLTARPGLLSALSSPKHSRASAPCPPPAYFPTPGAVDLAARSRLANLWIYQPSHQPFAFSTGLKETRQNVALFRPLLLSTFLRSSQTAKRSSASSRSAFFLILTASGFPVCLRYNLLET